MEVQNLSVAAEEAPSVAWGQKGNVPVIAGSDMPTNPITDLKRFYSLLDESIDTLGGPQNSGQLHRPYRLAASGSVFLSGARENRTGSGSEPRVVRVGTHALKAGSQSTLWGRLAQHRGQGNTGGGNHRGSIFRSWALR